MNESKFFTQDETTKEVSLKDLEGVQPPKIKRYEIRSKGKCDKCGDNFESIFENVKTCDICAQEEFSKHQKDIELTMMIGNAVLGMLKLKRKINNRILKNLVKNFKPANL